VAEELKVGREMVPQRVKSLAEELKATRKELDRLKSQVAVGAARQSLAQAETRSGIRILVTHIPGVQPDTLRDAATELRGEAGPSALVLAAAGPDRCALVCALSPEATALGLHAGNIIKQVAPLMGGSGGGKPDFAQAGGKDPSGIAPGLKKAHQLILEALTKS
jgi:alanyl-tRNA synthetase